VAQAAGTLGSVVSIGFLMADLLQDSIDASDTFFLKMTPFVCVLRFCW